MKVLLIIFYAAVVNAQNWHNVNNFHRSQIRTPVIEIPHDFPTWQEIQETYPHLIQRPPRQNTWHNGVFDERCNRPDESRSVVETIAGYGDVDFFLCWAGL
jgi:hypothetical protein